MVIGGMDMAERAPVGGDLIVNNFAKYFRHEISPI